MWYVRIKMLQISSWLAGVRPSLPNWQPVSTIWQWLIGGDENKLDYGFLDWWLSVRTHRQQKRQLPGVMMLLAFLLILTIVFLREIPRQFCANSHCCVAHTQRSLQQQLPCLDLVAMRALCVWGIVHNSHCLSDIGRLPKSNRRK